MTKWKMMVVSLLLGLLTFPLAACEKKGPAEKAGEQVDQAMEDAKEGMEQGAEAISDKIDPQGPAEKAGEKFDEAMDPDK
jgi:predicted small lipoprotein YifL